MRQNAPHVFRVAPNARVVQGSPSVGVALVRRGDENFVPVPVLVKVKQQIDDFTHLILGSVHEQRALVAGEIDEEE